MDDDLDLDVDLDADLLLGDSSGVVPDDDTAALPAEEAAMHVISDEEL